MVTDMRCRVRGVTRCFWGLLRVRITGCSKQEHRMLFRYMLVTHAVLGMCLIQWLVCALLWVQVLLWFGADTSSPEYFHSCDNPHGSPGSWVLLVHSCMSLPTTSVCLAMCLSAFLKEHLAPLPPGETNLTTRDLMVSEQGPYP